jgi:hypothetical protein
MTGQNKQMLGGGAAAEMHRWQAEPGTAEKEDKSHPRLPNTPANNFKHLEIGV